MIDLRDTLDAAGVTVARETRSEVVARCPMHVARTGKADRRPSWYLNKATFLHHCFSCGYKGTLTQLLVDLTGHAPVDLEIELHRDAFVSRMEAREQPEETLAPILPALTEYTLAHHLADLPQRLLELRWLARDAIDRYQVRWNPGTRQTVMPLWDAQDKLAGAQYRQTGSVLTLPAGLRKSEVLFGWRVVRDEDTAVLVESPLDAVRLFGLGIPAFASLGAWVSKEQVTLMARCFSFVVLALDNDKAGREGTEVAAGMLRRQGCATLRWAYTGLTDSDGAPAKDVGDVPDDEALVRAYSDTRSFGLGG